MEIDSDESKVVTNEIYVQISVTVHSYNFIRYLKFTLKSHLDFLILIIYSEDNRDYLLKFSNIRKSDVNQSVNTC